MRYLYSWTLLFLLSLSGMSPRLRAQVLTWDIDPVAAGVQNGGGTWNTTVANWIDSTNANVLWTNSGLETAQFGSLTPVNPSVVYLAGSMKLRALNFLSISGTTPVSGFQYMLNGLAAGTELDFGEGGAIQLADYSSGGSQFVALGANLLLKGNNLTIQKLNGGTVTQFINLNMVSNPNLTGMLTIGSYVYVGVTAHGTIANVSGVTINNNGTLVIAGTGGNYTMPIWAAGYANTYAAIRVTGSNNTLSGGITLTGDTGILMHSGNTGLLINSVINDGGLGYGLHRFSLTKNDGTVTLSASNTYAGKTTLGRTTSGFTGGITVLDFSGEFAPEHDILYHGLATAGGLDLIGSVIGASTLVLKGDADTDNSQRFGDVTVTGTRSVIEMTSGSGKSMDLSLGFITRTGSAMIAFSGPAQGAITTTTANGFMGPWATYKTGAGRMTWAQVSGGTITGFTGTTTNITGAGLSSDVTSHLTIDSESRGTVLQTEALTYLATLSMTDTWRNRTVTTGAGNTLRLAVVGGVQIASDARNLTIGELGVSSFLSAGGSSAGTGQLYLTNNSTTSLLTIHSGITNNAGGGAVTLLFNGASGSTTVLTGTSTYTGGTMIASGAVEIRNGAALGGSGTVTILDGASLRFSGGVNFARAVSLSGVGQSALVEGALRNVSGNNIVSGLITLQQPSSIISDAGTLTIQSASATTNAITGTFNLTLGGRSTIEVNGRINIGSGVLTKTGNGTLILSGDNSFTGGVTISGGALRVTHANALGTTAGATTIGANTALELFGGISLAAEPITSSSTGINNTGGIRNISGNNTLTGLLTLGGVTNIRINSDSGTLTFDTASGAAILHSSGTARVLMLGGSGNIDILDAVSRTSTGAFTIQKDGNGTVNLRTTVGNTVTTMHAGTLHLDFSAATSPTSNILQNGIATPNASPNELNMFGGTILITGRSGATNSQAFGNVTVTGSTTAIGGSSYINVAQNGATSVNLTFGTFTRMVGGIMGITRPTTGTMTTTGGVDNSIFLSALNTPYLWSLDAVNGDEWLGSTAISGGVRQIVPLSALPSGGYTASTATSLSGNANIASGVGTTMLSSAITTTTSLRFAQAQATTIGQDVTGRVLITSGILVSSTAGAYEQTIAVSILRAPDSAVNNDLTIIQNNTAAPLIITSAINNSLGGFATTVSKAGAGTLVLRGTNSFSGNLRVYEGTVHLQAGSLNGSTEILLGSGDKSGKVILGVGDTAYNTSVDWLQTMGTGTDNRIVGGATAISTLQVDNPTSANNYRNGFLGGSGTNENNLALTVNDTTAAMPTIMMLPLGGANTYIGQTKLRNGSVEVTVLADKGTASSLGTGSDNGIFEMGSGGSSTLNVVFAGIRYVGSTNSVTDRALEIANSTTGVLSITANLENNGTGTMQFTSAFTSTGTNTTATRKLLLNGTNAGNNRIVSVGDNGSAKTSVQKSGTGTWVITGDSGHGGGTVVDGGTLLVTNATGSGTGTGSVVVSNTARLGGTGRIAPGTGNGVSISGGVLTVGDSTLATPAAGRLEVVTSGGGALTFDNFGWLEFDLFHGAGEGDNSGDATAADLLVISGDLTIVPGSVLRVTSPADMLDWAAGDQWKLIDWTSVGTVTGQFGIVTLPELEPTLEWDISRFYTDGTISIMAVPEPGRMMLMGLAGAALLWRRGRKGESRMA